MISYSEFSRLRFQDFISEGLEEVDGYEYFDEIWIGEILEFSAFLRPESNPEKLECISLFFEELEEEEITGILAKLGLSIKPGEKEVQISEKIGKPVNKLTFIKDRDTYEYLIGSEEIYLLRLTVHKVEGLIFANILNHKPSIDKLKKKSK